MYDVVTVGNAVLDAFLGIHDADKRCRVQGEKGTTLELCIPLGEKILLDTYVLDLGGGACNVSVGLARLGFSSSIFAEIGDDEFGKKIVNGLEREHVETANLIRVNRQTSFTVGIHFQGERTLLASQTKGLHDFHFDTVTTTMLYLGGLGEEWEHVYHRALAFMQHAKAKLVFNPGPLQIKEGRDVLKEVLEITNIIFTNKEEAQEIIMHEENNIGELLRKVQHLGPRIVVITNAQHGSSVIDETGRMYTIDAFPCNVVEKTGAGNGYASGFMAATLKGKDVSETMRWGAVNAASVIEHVGAQKGLLSKEKIEKRLAENPGFKAKEI